MLHPANALELMLTQYHIRTQQHRQVGIGVVCSQKRRDSRLSIVGIVNIQLDLQHSPFAFRIFACIAVTSAVGLVTRGHSLAPGLIEFLRLGQGHGKAWPRQLHRTLTCRQRLIQSVLKGRKLFCTLGPPTILRQERWCRITQEICRKPVLGLILHQER